VAARASGSRNRRSAPDGAVDLASVSVVTTATCGFGGAGLGGQRLVATYPYRRVHSLSLPRPNRKRSLDGRVTRRIAPCLTRPRRGTTDCLFGDTGHNKWFRQIGLASPCSAHVTPGSRWLLCTLNMPMLYPSPRLAGPDNISLSHPHRGPRLSHVKWRHTVSEGTWTFLPQLPREAHAMQSRATYLR
jgi:hypothetical protein